MQDHSPTIRQGVSLQPYNTFGLEATARWFTEVNSIEALRGAIAFARDKGIPYHILGGGSNILLTQDPAGLVILMSLKGITAFAESENTISVKAMAGEVWHDFVLYTLDQHWGGIENLSLIPGTVGAAPMQNIGAYGVEIKDVFHSLEAWDTQKNEVVSFDKEACQFGYRWSRFKGADKGRYIILSMSLSLSKGHHKLHLDYGAIKDTLAADGITSPSIRDVSNAVIKIRQSKLPNPAEIGNAGSFFKNPSIPQAQYDALRQKHPGAPGYPLPGQEVKVPAGWLIEQSGWKGMRRGDIGVHSKQALVLVNHGGGNGSALWQLALDIKASVKDTFGIDIHPEVNIW